MILLLNTDLDVKNNVEATKVLKETIFFHIASQKAHVFWVSWEVRMMKYNKTIIMFPLFSQAIRFKVVFCLNNKHFFNE